jgi:hypothetical protein
VGHAGYLTQSQHEDDEPAGDPAGLEDGVILFDPGEHRDGECRSPTEKLPVALIG